MLSGNRTLTGPLCSALFVACVITANYPLAPAFGQALPPADAFPGGFIEQATSTQVRPLLSASQLQLLLPATRGPFVFPDPYNTQGIRLTDASDCVGSTDCVNSVGSAYWRRINNHVGSDTMLIVLGLDRARGGAGPTLFQYNKVTAAVTNLGPLFDSTSPLSGATGDMWYFSAIQPTTIYVNDGPRLLGYDVMVKTSVTVFDVSTQPAPIGPNPILWKLHSSNDDRVHSATLKDSATLADLGCVTYHEDTRQFFYVPQHGFLYDECQIDKSGRWLLIKEKLYASTPGVDNRMIDLTTGVETDLLYQNGAASRCDNGFGYMVATDNWNSGLNAIRLWKFGTFPLGPGTVVYYAPQGLPKSVQHVSHANANPTLRPEQQYACGSGADSTNGPRVNEVVCFLLDGSFRVLVVAPVMTDMNATGGGDAYSKLPKGNLDVTGQYFIWTSNVGTSRLDAFLVKVPAHVLTNLLDTTPPTVSITSPAAGVTVADTVTVAVSATDNVGVVGVQFKLDGLNLGAELTAAPYAVSWTSTTASNGTHTLTALARDAAGNLSTSVGVSLTVSNAIAYAPWFAVTPSSITSSSAAQVTLAWDPNTDPDLVGYKLYYGTSSRSYQFSVDVGNVTSYRIAGLLEGQIYYLATTAYNVRGIESYFSNEV